MTKVKIFLQFAAFFAIMGGAMVASPVEIPLLSQPPRIEDFVPPAAGNGHLAQFSGFVQRTPRDGQPATFPTRVWAGYDRQNLYLIFLASDPKSENVRARLVRREQIGASDDWVEVMLDTFQDRRRAYVFRANPRGVQWDALWTEGQGFDSTFDTLWHSKGRVDPNGYTVLMTVPFKSLRFPAVPSQKWGIVLSRHVPRGQAEDSTWPHVSTRIEGRLNQAGELTGLNRISPGRNLQLIPYAGMRSFQVLDDSLPGGPGFVGEDLEVDGGLDAKYVLRDSLVLDLTLNPDFSQVESDAPQVTVNRRFEVFFPERRPFFLENANFFRTPLNLVFTRRIADPQFGARLTGKVGPWALGALVSDDQAPGRSPEGGDQRALFAVARVNRDIFSQSSIGMVFTDREFGRSYNRVAGVDGRFKLNSNWVARFLAVASSDRGLEGDSKNGRAFNLQLSRSGRQFSYFGNYTDISKGFQTDVGFVPRRDLRDTTHFASYFFRPEKKHLIFWGPEFFFRRNWDQSGTRLDELAETSLEWHFPGQTAVEINYRAARERLRVTDAPNLAADTDFKLEEWVLELGSSFSDHYGFGANFSQGRQVHLAPAGSQAPSAADWDGLQLFQSFRPVDSQQLNLTYLWTRLRNLEDGSLFFNNHVMRLRWNWQLSREFSLRAIAQYESVLPNAELSSLERSKNLNLDFLLTYLVNPWTALYVGYNSNLQNLEFQETTPGRRLLRRRDEFLNDGRQLFVKLSYLFRF